MNAPVFPSQMCKQWMAGLGLAAMLLLALVPASGRMLQAAAAAAHGAQDARDADAMRGLHAGHHGHHGHHAAADDDGDAPRPAPVDGAPDCDYCPLLNALAIVPPPPLPQGAVAVAPLAAAAPAAPRLPWLHPTGLGSRGPPALG